MDYSSGPGTAPEWVSIPDAAEISGLSASTLLTWCRAGSLASQVARTDQGEQRVVRLADVVSKVRMPDPVAGPTVRTSAELVPLMTALPDIIRDLADARERAARAETKVEFLKEQIASLKREGEQAAPPPSDDLPPALEGQPLQGTIEPEISSSSSLLEEVADSIEEQPTSDEEEPATDASWLWDTEELGGVNADEVSVPEHHTRWRFRRKRRT